VFRGSRSNQQIRTCEGVEGDELIVAGVANEVVACVRRAGGDSFHLAVRTSRAGMINSFMKDQLIAD